MTLHSFTEGVGVGAAFGSGKELGLAIAIAIAVHNIPEGLAISLVLVPRGASVKSAAGWSISPPAADSGTGISPGCDVRAVPAGRTRSCGGSNAVAGRAGTVAGRAPREPSAGCPRRGIRSGGRNDRVADCLALKAGATRHRIGHDLRNQSPVVRVPRDGRGTSWLLRERSLSRLDAVTLELHLTLRYVPSSEDTLGPAVPLRAE